MINRLLADLLVAVHLLFILYVVFGGLTVMWRLRLAWAHLPVALWGASIELVGWVCPLTPLEIRLRLAAGQQGYAGGFVEHYILPLVYPPGLTRGAQLVLGGLVVAVNLAIYAFAMRRARRRSRRRSR